MTNNTQNKSISYVHEPAINQYEKCGSRVIIQLPHVIMWIYSLSSTGLYRCAPTQNRERKKKRKLMKTLVSGGGWRRKRFAWPSRHQTLALVGRGWEDQNCHKTVFHEKKSWGKKLIGVKLRHASYAYPACDMAWSNSSDSRLGVPSAYTFALSASHVVGWKLYKLFSGVLLYSGVADDDDVKLIRE